MQSCSGETKISKIVPPDEDRESLEELLESDDRAGVSRSATVGEVEGRRVDPDSLLSPVGQTFALTRVNDNRQKNYLDYSPGVDPQQPGLDLQCAR